MPADDPLERNALGTLGYFHRFLDDESDDDLDRRAARPLEDRAQSTGVDDHPGLFVQLPRCRVRQGRIRGLDVPAGESDVSDKQAPGDAEDLPVITTQERDDSALVEGNLRHAPQGTTQAAVGSTARSRTVTRSVTVRP